MNIDRDWNALNDRLDALRDETVTRHLLKQHPAPARQPANVWARLLPRLRRLEGWLERHAGGEVTAQLR